ncbi:uncharacterized protein LOC126879500 [Diabrotica virgifera virgifera]|uniref:MADF domain-containing protein n=1 Tax=Diabrotica virgifera virgifera TaxID=50390 RepID=A0ABM5JKQ2_DIAVI|nr:uncharacterized protein LOC126879500 [Diabrotica virgifera virgifera]
MEYLINSVKKYPCIWKADSEDYKNTEMKKASWRKIIKECDYPDVKEAKHLWKILRDGHRQAISKKRTATGQAASDIKPWKYEKLMEFLLPHISSRVTSTNTMSSGITTTDEDSQLHEEIRIETIDDQPAITSTYLPKRKNDQLLDYLHEQESKREKRSFERDLCRRELLKQLVVKPKTATEKFFDSMCDMTTDLPEHVQIKIQREIFQAVMEAREAYLRSQTGTSGLVGLNYPRHEDQSAFSASSASRPSSALSNGVAACDVLSLHMKNSPATSTNEFILSEEYGLKEV